MASISDCDGVSIREDSATAETFVNTDFNTPSSPPKKKKQERDLGDDGFEDNYREKDKEDEEEEEEEVPWMTREEENMKIIETLKEVAAMCSRANFDRRPTAFQVLKKLAKVYEPPKEPFSFAACIRFLCSNEEEFEYPTSETEASSKFS